jgi:hypothetical protein
MSSQFYNARQVQNRFLEQLLEGATSIGPHYIAGGTKRSAFSIEEPLNYLRVNGVLWDEIDTIHEPFIADLDSDPTNSTRLTTAVETCRETVIRKCIDKTSPYGSDIEILAAFWTTIFAGQTVTNTGKEVLNDWPADVKSPWESNIPAHIVLDAGRLELTHYALGRRFFITRNGYFGLGPLAARTGDRVVVLLGVDVPLMLRRSHSMHQVVGEAYIEGTHVW